MGVKTCSVRWMTNKDVEAVTRIAKRSGSRLREEDFYRSIRTDSMVNMVLDCGGEICGYVMYQVSKYKVELLGIAVLETRTGYGTELVEGVLRRLTKTRPRCVLKVPEENLPAQHFFHACGFRAVRVVHGDEGDSILFVRRLTMEEFDE